VELRPATLTDATAILAVYNREVLESATTLDLVPRTMAEQEAYITSRSGGLAVLVAEHQGTRELAGFGSLSFYRDRPGYRTSVENSVYVHRDHHRSGVGNLLLSGLIEQAREHGFHSVFARIVDCQEPSMNLHRRHGYDLVGVEREVGRKFGQWRDVAVMQLLL
jgi:L-amino acid N-acyltransferase